MIETILEQVERSVDRFVRRNPQLRNDRDDLVQDVFMKILPRVGGEDHSLSECRAYAHRATYWVCQTALRRHCNKKRKNTRRLAAASVYLIGDVLHRRDSDSFDDHTHRVDIRASEFENGAIIPDKGIACCEEVERIVDANYALFTWYDVETDPEIRESLREQIIALFEFLT